MAGLACSKSSYVEVITHILQNMSSFGERVLTEVPSYSEVIRVGPNSMGSVS